MIKEQLAVTSNVKQDAAHLKCINILHTNNST